MENLSQKRDFLKTNGSNHILKDKKLLIHWSEPFSIVAKIARLKIWRARLQPIRTLSEIKASIVIEPAQRIPLYQTIAKKAKQLHLLGMSYQQISKSLNIDKATVRKACKYEGG